MKRVIFGGSFDPLTLAHYDMGEKLSRDFDEVIVVPAYVSPFKIGEMELTGDERLALVRQGFGNIPNVVVSDCELKAEGTSYSYLTAQRFARAGDELYFAIGSDGLGGLTGWSHPEILARLVTFYVVERPYFPIKQSELDSARRVYKVEVAPYEGKEGSSSLLKVAVAFDRAREVVPDFVADYIEKRGLYRDYRFITDRYHEFGLKQSRVEHVYRVAKAAIILAKKNGANVHKTIIAALLHDVTKYSTEKDLNRYGVTEDEKTLALPPQVRHQRTGAAIAKAAFGITDPDILSAIETHTTGAENMNVYQKIVFAADYIEDGRKFDGIDDIRRVTYDDLDKGVIAILENTIKYLAATGETIAPETALALNAMKKGENNG